MADAWFYLPTIPPPGERIALSERESRHAVSSRRLREGDRISVFDGTGRVAGATIRAAGKAIDIELGESHLEPPLIPEIHLATALPKGDRQSVMLSMLAQLGIASFTPLLCDRSIVKVGSGFADRAARICIEACKQSRHALLPVIHEPRRLAETLRELGEDASSSVFAHPCRDPIDSSIAPLRTANRITIMVGPEGGFTEAEVEAARDAGAIIVDLGRTILRTETAAVALTSLLRLSSF